MELLAKREYFQEGLGYYQTLLDRLQEEGRTPDERTQQIATYLRTKPIMRERAVSATGNDAASITTASFVPTNQYLPLSDFSHAVTQGIIEAMRTLVGDNMDQLKRQLLQNILGVVGTTLLVPLERLNNLENGGVVQPMDTPFFRLFSYMLSLCWEHYYTSGSQSIVPILDYCLHALGGTIEAVHGREHISLLTLLCRYYQLSSVVARDRLDLVRALQDGKKSIELAFHLENAELLAASLFRRAKTYLKLQQYDKALQDLEAAFPYAQRSRDPLKGYIHQATAEAYTLSENRDQHVQKKVFLFLDTVKEILDNGNLEDDGSFVKVNTAGLALDRANAFIRFQQPEEARQQLTIVRQHLGVELMRWQSRLFIAEAETYLIEHDPQSCCEVLFEALKIVYATHSRSNQMRIDTLYQQLKVCDPHHLLVCQLGEQLHAL